MASRLVSKRSLGVDSKPVVPWGKDEKPKKRKTKNKPRKSVGQGRVSGKQRKMVAGLPSY